MWRCCIMKPIYRCEYCSQTGTEEEILKHEEECIHNYNKKSCYTCACAERYKVSNFKCKCGNDIPEGHYMKNCDEYKWDGVEHTKRDTFGFGNLFGGLF